jgi:hypothetical protein
MMFDFESKLNALVDNYGLGLLVKQSDIEERVLVKFMIDEGYLDLDDYFFLDVEMEEWERMEE